MQWCIQDRRNWNNHILTHLTKINFINIITLPRTFLAAKSRWTIPRLSRYSMPYKMHQYFQDTRQPIRENPDALWDAKRKECPEWHTPCIFKDTSAHLSNNSWFQICWFLCLLRTDWLMTTIRTVHQATEVTIWQRCVLNVHWTRAQ